MNNGQEKNILNATIGGRIKSLRESKGLNQAQLAEKIGVQQAFISKVEKNLAKFTLDHIILLRNIFAFDMNWLFTGVGEMNLQQVTTANEPEAQYFQPGADNPQIREMVGIMLDLDETARTDLLRQAKKELKLKRLEDVDQEKSELIDALEPRVAERLKKLENITPEAAEGPKKQSTVTVRKRKKVLQ